MRSKRIDILVLEVKTLCLLATRHVMMEALVPMMAEILFEMSKQVMNEREVLACEHLRVETDCVLGQKHEMMIT
jgi:hypothetical protein